MKKMILAVLLMAAIMLSACSPSEAASTTTTLQTENGMSISTQPTETTSTVKLTAEEIYNDLLRKLHTRINKIIGDDTYLDGLSSELGMAGVAEMAYQAGVDMMDQYGYTIRDINGDGNEELLICAVSELTSSACVGTEILCAFSVSDGELALIFEGWSGNRYFILDDGSFYRSASDGAANTTNAVYTVSQENQMVCADFYFTDIDEQQKPLYFHNTIGENDPAKSEAVEGGTDAYMNIVKGYTDRVQNIELTVLSAFEG